MQNTSATWCCLRWALNGAISNGPEVLWRWMARHHRGSVRTLIPTLIRLVIGRNTLVHGTLLPVVSAILSTVDTVTAAARSWSDRRISSLKRPRSCSSHIYTPPRVNSWLHQPFLTKLIRPLNTCSISALFTCSSHAQWGAARNGRI